MKPLAPTFFEQSAVELAPKLLGKIIRKGDCAGIIVETEAYGTDPASHAYTITPRSQIMRDTYGCWYVYFTYGMHYCANVTCDKGGVGAVLIRAVEPTEGIEQMVKRRYEKKASRSGAAFFRALRSSSVKSDLLHLATHTLKNAPPLAPSSLFSLTNGPAKFCEAFAITKKENGLPVVCDLPASKAGFAIFDAPIIPKKQIATSPRIGIREGLDLPWRFFIKGNPFVS